ncbi:MAG: cytochrome c [Beijerinckiaceae bacterium]|nr:cytochrome c [Beijerinckiaceae bacterium]
MRRLALVIAALAVAGFGVFWFLTTPDLVAQPGDKALETPGDPALGQVVFFAGGCASCHTTPAQPNRMEMGGGLPLFSPFGTFFAPNISPHPTDGIGSWTNAQLANAMLRGVSPEGKHYYPAFPYTSYARMTLDDVRHLGAYLRTLPAVSGKVRSHDVNFPFSIRRQLGIWKWLYMDTSPIVADPSKDASWNRGHYLVEALGHCAECHSSRNLLRAIIPALRYAGGPDIEDKGWVPAIAPPAIKDWTRGEWVQLLEMGITPDGDSVGGTMVSVVKNMSELPKSDLQAMADYLRTLPPREPQKPPKK